MENNNNMIIILLVVVVAVVIVIVATRKPAVKAIDKGVSEYDQRRANDSTFAKIEAKTSTFLSSWIPIVATPNTQVDTTTKANWQEITNLQQTINAKSATSGYKITPVVVSGRIDDNLIQQLSKISAEEAGKIKASGFITQYIANYFIDELKDE